MTICCTADGAPGLVHAAKTALGCVTRFIGEQPNHPQWSKEHSIRLLRFCIKGRGPLTPETYEEKMGEMWAGLKAIVNRPGGVEAFLDADGDSWAMTFLKNGQLHMKVCCWPLSADPIPKGGSKTFCFPALC